MKNINSSKLFIPALFIFYLIFVSVTRLRFIFIDLLILLFYLSHIFKDKMKALFIMLIIALPFEKGLLSIHIQGSLLTLSLPILTMIPLLILIIKENKIKEAFTYENIFLLLYLIWSLISLFFNASQDFMGNIIYILFPGFLFLISKNLSRDKSLRSFITVTLISSLILQLYVGLIQAYFQNPLRIYFQDLKPHSVFGQSTNENPELFRIMGLTKNPARLAEMITIIFPLLLTELFLGISQIPLSLITLTLISSVIILIFTYVRSSWLIISFSAVAQCLMYYKKYSLKLKLIRFQKALFTILFVLLLLISPQIILRLGSLDLFFHNETSSGTVRIRLLQQSLKVIQNNPIIGIGPGNSSNYYLAQNKNDLYSAIPNITDEVHSFFTQITVNSGIPALIFFILFIFSVLKKYFTVYRKLGRKERIFSTSYFFGISNILIFSLLFPIIYTPNYNYLFLFLGFLTGYERKD